MIIFVQIVINSMIGKETVYVKTQEKFHQFQDPRYVISLGDCI